jgi:hypothetical protein
VGASSRVLAAIALVALACALAEAQASPASVPGAADYAPNREALALHLGRGDYAAALGDAQALLGLGPRDPAAPRAVMDAYYAAGRYDDLAAFFESGIRSFFLDDLAQGNLYRHYAMLAHDTGDDALARDLIDKAERAYVRGGGAGAAILEAMDAEREAYGD